MKVNKKIRVDSCKACPFCDPSDEYRDRCNISKEVTNSLGIDEDLPYNRVHDLCPLKQKDFIVTIKV